MAEPAPASPAPPGIPAPQLILLQLDTFLQRALDAVAPHTLYRWLSLGKFPRR